MINGILFYKAIREATYFLQNVDKCPDPRLTYDTREQWKAEIRCVRAYYYAQLMRMYGPVILLKDEHRISLVRICFVNVILGMNVCNG